MYARSSVRHACAALSVLFLCALGRAASAQTNAYYTVGTYTVDAAHSVTGAAYAGQDTNGSRTSNQSQPYNPTVNVVTGGSIGNYLETFNSSMVNVSGGSIGSVLNSFDSSVVNFSGGSIGGNLDTFDNSTVNVSGGRIGGNLFTRDSSTVNVSGGTAGNYDGVNFVDDTTGAFTLIGSNLAAISLGADTNGFDGTDYALSGTLQDGTNLSGYIINVGSGATMFTLQSTPAAVPEPGSVALFVGLGVTGAGLLVRRRRASA